jgi:hypothetical protein
MSQWAWMGIAWGNMEDGCIGSKHSSRKFTCFWGLSYLGIKTCVGLLVETWHVSMGGRFWVSSFKTHIFEQLKLMSSPHRNMTCFCVGLLRAHTARMWKLMLGCLEMSDAFTTCRWNNIEAYIPIMTSQRFCSLVVEVLRSIRFPPMLVEGVFFFYFFWAHFCCVATLATVPGRVSPD